MDAAARVSRFERDDAAAGLARIRASIASLESEKEALAARMRFPPTDFIIETGRYVGHFMRGMRAEIDRLDQRISDLKAEAEKREAHVRALHGTTRVRDAAKDAARRALDTGMRREEDRDQAELTRFRWLTARRSDR
mgnify:FL=1